MPATTESKDITVTISPSHLVPEITATGGALNSAELYYKVLIQSGTGLSKFLEVNSDTIDITSGQNVPGNIDTAVAAKVVTVLAELT